jgi:uncharacterized membrane protein
VKKNCSRRHTLFAVLRFFPVICLIAAAVFSVVFVFSHQEHDCTGEYCPVCIQLAGAGSLMKHLAAAGIACLAAGISSPGVRRTLKLSRFVSPPLVTAVSLKVQLNN